MKIRNGFVSNSSSSSFIIKLDVIPTSIEHLMEIIFGKNIPENCTYYNYTIPTNKLIETVFNDINIALIEDKDITFEQCSLDELLYISQLYIKDDDILQDIIGKIHQINVIENEIDVIYDSYDFTEDTKQNNIIMNNKYGQIDSIENEISSIITNNIKNLYPNSKFIEIEYSEHTLLGSILEHGNILNKICFYKISLH